MPHALRVVPPINTRPDWAKALIVAELHEDACEYQSDYFNARLKRTVALAWSRNERDLFAEMRKAAARFPETAHLGPGRGVFKPWVVLSEDYGIGLWKGGPSRFQPHRDLYEVEYGKPHDFQTKVEAEAFVAAQGAPEVLTAIVAGVERQVVAEWEIRETEIEHREKYSMGAGYYLKAGGRYDTGWSVRKISGRLDGLTELEWA